MFYVMTLILACAPAADANPASLEGSYAVQLVDPAKVAEADTLVFRAGRFESLTCREWTFGDAPYTLEGATFTAETRSPTEGTMRWTGTFTGDHLKGTTVWTKTGQAPIQYTFSGTRK
jgi:hypothetical protein